MASRFQFLYSKQPKLTLASGIITFGTSGAVSSIDGAGLLSCTKLATGVYEVKLKEVYTSFLSADFHMSAGTSGSAVTDGAFVTGTLYQIQTLGTTNFAAVGYDTDFAPVVGGTFVATGAGGAGGGTVKAVTPTGIIAVETLQSPQAMLKNLNSPQGKGSAIAIQTLGLPSSGQTPALASPAAGAQLGFKFWFRDTSAKVA